MKLNFNKAGAYDGVIKTLKVVAWIASAGAITALADWLSNLQIDSSNYIVVAVVGVVNAVLAGLAKWLSVKR